MHAQFILKRKNDNELIMLNRKAWKNIPNGWFNEKDELITVLSKQHLTGSARYCNVFHCSKCLKRYFLPWNLKRHAEKCNTKFTSIIFEENELTIAYVNHGSSPLERLICERFSLISRAESSWDFPIIHKNNWHVGEVKSHVFLLLKNKSVISYLIIRDRKLEKDGKLKDYRVLSDAFTAHDYRRRGYAKILLLKTLEFFGETFKNIVFLEPFTKKGSTFIETVAKSLGVSKISTCH